MDNCGGITGVDTMPVTRCIALYSGGLDSILAVKMMEKQGIEVFPVKFYSPFFGFDIIQDPDAYRQYHLNTYGIDVTLEDFTQDIIEIVKNPKHGYGKHLNPCIDCKIAMLRKARGFMDALGASFVITGEVVGQRPMSQRRDSMNSIVRESGLEDILLRPLSAKLLKETFPERTGTVNRENLGDIAGRGRKDQILLAQEFAIDEDTIPTPAGGCLLTDGHISSKIKNTFDRFHPGLPGKEDIILDVVGRKFILDEGTVLVVSRSDEENRILTKLTALGNIFVKIADVPGPLSILRGAVTKEAIMKAASICMRYGKARGLSGHYALYGTDPQNLTDSIESPVVTEEYCRTFQIDLHK